MPRWLIQTLSAGIALALAIVVGRWAGGDLIDETGAPAAAVHLAADGFIPFILGLAALTAISLIASRGLGPSMGGFTLGVGLIALAGRMGTSADFIRAPQSSLMLLTLEVVVLGALAWGWLQLVYRAAPRASSHGERVRGSAVRWIISAPVLLAACIAVVWLFSQSLMKSQTIAAATAAGLVAGLLGVLFITHRPRSIIVAMVPLAGAIGYVLAASLGEPLTLRSIGEGWLALLNPMPLDCLAGSITGACIGMAWGASLLVGEEPEAARNAAAPAESKD